MQTRKSYISRACSSYKVLAFAALTLLCAPLATLFAQNAVERNYDQVPDILNGQHTLLRIDDLVMLSKNGDNNVIEWEFKTSNGEPLVWNQGCHQRNLPE